VELVAYAALFYVLQCLVYVPHNAVVFMGLRGLGRVRVFPGGGLRLMNLWPSGLSVVASRLPLVISDRSVECTTSLYRSGLRSSTNTVRSVPITELTDVCLSGSVVKVGSRPFIRAVSQAHGYQLLSLLADVGRASPPERKRAVERAIRDSLTSSVLRERYRAARAAVRLLGLCCDTYALILFVGTPCLILLTLEDPVLFYALPLLGALHLVTLAALYRAHRKLNKSEWTDLAELMIVCALFPPALLRTPQNLLNASITGFHPAAFAQLLLDRAGFLRFVQRELALLRYSAHGVADPTAVEERDEVLDKGRLSIEALALEALAAESGFSWADLVAPHSSSDPQAASYCQLCGGEYLEGVTRCVQCQVPTRRCATAVS
jgi:hypothetical protein